MFELFDPKADIRRDYGSNLPHWYQPGVSYFITFRTEDSIPINVSRLFYAKRTDWLTRHGIDVSTSNWQVQVDRLSVQSRREFHETFSKQYLDALNKGYGDCLLRLPEIRKIVVDSLLHFDGTRYQMSDFVVMPNHVHMICCLLGSTDLAAQCKSWKRYTANEIRKRTKTKGRFWQEESFDHLIRSQDQFVAIQRYISANPANLRSDEYQVFRRTEIES